MKNEYFYEVYDKYKKIRPSIEKRLGEYREIWEKGSNEDIHAELCFCILTPQSKAKNAWKAITNMREEGVLFTAPAEKLSEYLNIVRFKNNKARYLVELREKMTDENGNIITRDFFDSIHTVEEKREWIVKNIKGMAYKEAGHFLRNIGFGENLAILDRHILKNIVKLGIIEEVPRTLTKRLYLEIEDKMREFCKEVDIPMDHIDLFLWYLEAGEIFK